MGSSLCGSCSHSKDLASFSLSDGSPRRALSRRGMVWGGIGWNGTGWHGMTWPGAYCGGEAAATGAEVGSPVRSHPGKR